jgi:hypothetical protein
LRARDNRLLPRQWARLHLRRRADDDAQVHTLGLEARTTAFEAAPSANKARRYAEFLDGANALVVVTSLEGRNDRL